MTDTSTNDSPITASETNPGAPPAPEFRWDPFEALWEVRDDERITGAQALVMFVLVARAALRSDPNRGRVEGTRIWGEKRLARESKLTPGALHHALQVLQGLGLVRVTPLDVDGSNEPCAAYELFVGWVPRGRRR